MGGEGGGKCNPYVVLDFECVACSSAKCLGDVTCMGKCSSVSSSFATRNQCENEGGPGGAAANPFVCLESECVKCSTLACINSETCVDMCMNPSSVFSNVQSCNQEGGMGGAPCSSWVCLEESKQCVSCDELPVVGETILGAPPEAKLCEDDGVTPFASRGQCQGNCKKPVVARKDPHLYLPHGGRADFRGEHNKIFNFLSAKGISFNVKMLLSSVEPAAAPASRPDSPSDVLTASTLPRVPPPPLCRRPRAHSLTHPLLEPTPLSARVV